MESLQGANARLTWRVETATCPLLRTGDQTYVCPSWEEGEDYDTAEEAEEAFGEALLGADRLLDRDRYGWLRLSQRLHEWDGERWEHTLDVWSETWTYLGGVLLRGDVWDSRRFDRLFDTDDTGEYRLAGVSVDGGDTYRPIAELTDREIERAWRTFDREPRALWRAVARRWPGASPREVLEHVLAVRGGVAGRTPRGLL